MAAMWYRGCDAAAVSVNYIMHLLANPISLSVTTDGDFRESKHPDIR